MVILQIKLADLVRVIRNSSDISKVQLYCVEFIINCLYGITEMHKFLKYVKKQLIGLKI